MLSILIPTFNYNSLSLVKELHQQILLENIDFEIIVQDDASPENENTLVNSTINQLQNCRFERNEFNLGRSKNRNSLISKSKYPWILLMDGDTFPKNKDFVKKYIECIKNTTEKAVFGGIGYYEEKPKDNEMLRWIFGKKREEISLKNRLESPYKTTLISNFLIQKELFTSFSFDSEIINYGYEDVLFVLNFKKNNIKIGQIDNLAFHLNLENSEIFLEKFHSSLNNLKKILDENKITFQDTSLTQTYYWVTKFKMVTLISFLFAFFQKKISKNLVSKNPSLLLFDLYRLGFFCSINSKK